MPQSISVVIIDSSTDSLNNIVRYIKDLNDDVTVEGVSTSFDKGFELIHKKRPMVVIMEIGKDIELSLERITQILNRFPQTSIFATCEDKSSDTILKVMRAGVTEYLLRPVNDTDLSLALQKIGRLWLQKILSEAEAGLIFTVFSPKGGVGATTIAINLAANIYEITNKPTVLIDLDLNAGDVTTFLNMKTSYTITDVTSNISRLDKSFLQGVIAKHKSGIFVLAEPQKVEEGVSIVSAEIKKVLGLLKTMFTYIIVDAETVSDRTITALNMSDMVLVTFYMSLPGIRNMQRYLRFFDHMGLGRDTVKIIVNRYLKKEEISVQDAEKALGYPIFWTIPNDYKIAMTCLNQGVPFSLGAPKSQINLSIKDMAKAILERKQ